MMALTATQLKERRKFLGASECAAALGVSPFFTTVQLWDSKLKEDAPTIESTIPQMVGTALEPVCLELLERERGQVTLYQQAFLEDKKRPWRRATIDGYLESEGAVVEAKTSGDYRGWGEPGTDQIPLPYMYNIHHTFGCMGSEVRKAIFPVLLAGRSFQVFEVQRDDELVEIVAQQEDLFRHCWVNKTPPAPVDAGDLKILYPRSNGRPITATNPIIEDFRRWREIRQTRIDAEKSEEEVAFRLKEFLKDHEILTDGNGTPLCTFKGSPTTRVDVTKLREQAPDLARKFTVESIVRKLLLKAKS